MNRRRFLQGLAAAGALECTRLTPYAQALATGKATKSGYKPGRVPNEYSLFLPGEREALSSPPLVSAIQGRQITLKSSGGALKIGESADGWKLVSIVRFNGATTAIFEKHVTHRGAIAYVTAEQGVIANIPKMIGRLSSIRPRPTNTPDVRFERTSALHARSGRARQLHPSLQRRPLLRKRRRARRRVHRLDLRGQ